MRTVGTRKERQLTMHASGKLLLEGAKFNSDMQKIQSTFRFPKGVYRYMTHEEANAHMTDCVVASVVAVQERRNDGR